MQILIPANHAKDTVIICLSPEKIDDWKTVVPIVKEKSGVPFVVTLVSDVDHKVIDLYGLLNQEGAAWGDFLPDPTTYVIDGAGKVRWRFTEKNEAVRPTNQMILAELKKLW